mmetsp:Transcript_37360/g.88321  ORF Transcript_37360/g.88321 Transcript_37360/m.88321 type:complete len:97 (-) Transcript_37360:174-464(-)
MSSGCKEKAGVEAKGRLVTLAITFKGSYLMGCPGSVIALLSRYLKTSSTLAFPIPPSGSAQGLVMTSATLVVVLASEDIEYFLVFSRAGAKNLELC